MNHQLGLTLLEVCIALSIGGVILLFSIGGLQYFERHAAINEVKSEIALLQFAAEEYHLQYGGCDSFDKTPDITDLIIGAFLPAGFNPDNAFGEGYTVDFGADSQVDSKPPVYDISLELKNALRINTEYYAQSLGATDFSDGTLSWVYPILASTPNQAGSLRQFRKFYGKSDEPRAHCE